MRISAWLGALLLATLVAVACGDGDDAPGTPGAVAHPTGPREVILQYDVYGGLIPYPAPLTAPKLVLYGDGRLLLRGQDGIDEVRLAEPGIQRLLRVVLEARFFDTPEFTTSNGCADCPTTRIRAAANGASKTADVYALGIATPEATYDTAAWQRLEGLARFLDAVTAATFRPGDSTGSGPYAPGALWVQSFATEIDPPPTGAVPDWPASLPPAATLMNGAALCGAQAQTLRALLPAGGAVRDGSGISFIGYRDLLPDDAGADACGL